MSEKCPYCYRPLGIHTHDPILLPNGSRYKWDSDTELVEVLNIVDRIYRGIYQINEDDIIDLQDELKDLEEENLPVIDRTVFSPLNSTGKFQITGKHIKEMRDSVEKLLDIFGLTKTDYFNYDEDNNHIIHPLGDKIDWTDPITISTDLQKFQVKYIHIEDLRHFLQVTFYEEFKNEIYQPIQVYRLIEGNPLDINPIIITNETLYCYYSPLNNSWVLSHNIGQDYDWRFGTKSEIDAGSYSKVEITGNRTLKISYNSRNFISGNSGRFIGGNFSGTFSPLSGLNTFPINNYLLNNNKCIDFDCIFNDISSWFELSTKPRGNPLRVNFVFSGGKELEYYFRPGITSAPGWGEKNDFFINSSGLVKFCRNIYDDFILAGFGIPSSTTYILRVDFFSNLLMINEFTFPVIDGNWYEMNIEIDNIGVRNLTTPIITPAFQGS
jgi:hypothetical protein